MEIEEKPPMRSVFKFEISEQASKHNEKILRTFDYDYEAVLEKKRGTNIYYGSEFRNYKTLAKLLKYHKSWDRFKTFLSKGTDTTLSKLDDETLRKDCMENIKRGNHKSSSKSKDVIDFVNKQYKKEVSKGWMIPIPTNALPLLKNACVIPIGVTSQFTINEKAETIRKLRLTHDCSWEGPSNFSINNRIDESKLAPLQYGRCILRVLHNIQFMRYKNPNRRILIFKHDLDSAYRRLHWHAKCALLCITIVQNLAYILTRLCFGIASGPSEWCVISETIVDYAAILMKDKTWNASELFNPHEDISSKIEYLDDSIKCENTKDIISKNIETTDSYVDGYIDDLLTITLDDPDLVTRGSQAIPLMCHTIFRPVHKNEPLPRTNILSKAKLIAEGMPSEQKTFLGWIIDTRRMRISLPKLKAFRWISEIDNLLTSKKSKHKDLESILGKLNHAAFLIPLSRYFLNRIRHTESLAKKFGPQKLPSGTINDLELFKDLLSMMSSKGNSIQNVTHSLPDIFCWSDACEYGIGGYNSKGKAWQWKIPSHLMGKFSINLLEFLAAVVTITISLEDAKQNTRIFALTDNSSALGWMFKASFHPETKEQHNKIARYLAKFLVQKEHSLYAEHISGSKNNVADSLSREFEFTKNELTNLISNIFTNQIPENFEIHDIPNKTAYWILSILEAEIPSKEQGNNLTKKKIQIGKSGATFVEKLESKMNFYKIIQDNKKSISYVASQLQSEETFLENQRKKYCREIPSKAQYDMFARSSGLMDSTIQELMKVD